MRRAAHRTARHVLLVAALAVAAPAIAARAALAQGVPPTPPAGPPGTPAAAAQPDVRSADASAPAAVAQAGGKLGAYYAVPEMPATTILGVTPAAITRPITPKDFASSLIDGIDESGHARQGLAIETSLGLFHAFRVPLATYQTSARARFWSNVLLSFATTRTAGDTASTDLAWGVRAPLIDRGDPLAHPAFTRRLGAALLRCAPEGPPRGVFRGQRPGESAGEYRAAFDSATRAMAADTARQLAMATRRAEQLACLDDAATQTGKDAADSLWNAARLMLAYAGSTRLVGSSFGHGRRLEDRVWLVGALPVATITGPVPIARSSQIIGYADYVRRHAIDTLPSTSGASVGARLDVGSAALNGFGEILGEWIDNPAPGAKRSTTALSAGIEFLAAPGTWISTGIGRRYAEAVNADKTVIFANIRWGVSSKPFLQTGPGAP
jgi:hypothetical protein